MLKSPVIFYHLWPVGEWKRIQANIFNKIVETGLAKSLSKMYICVNSDIPFSEIDLHGISEDKVEILRIRDTQSEWPTIQILYEKYVNDENTPLLYIHCKGARFVNRDHSYYAINSWVDGLTYFNITKWKKCINYLASGKLSVGIRVARLPIPHYSGNFWWINSKAIRMLIDPKTQDQSFRNRHGAEFWIGRLGIANLFDSDMLRNQFSYNSVIDPRRYVDMTGAERAMCIHRPGVSDTSWVNRIGYDFDIYQKNSNISIDSTAMAYVTYIIDNYETLPKYVYFLSSMAMSTVYNLEQLLKNQYRTFHPLGRLRTKDTCEGVPNHPGLPLRQKWDSIFENGCPDWFEFTPGSNFGVSREEIQKYSKNFYINIREKIETKDIPVDDYCFERMWESIFTKNNQERVTKLLNTKTLLSIPLERVMIITPEGVESEYSDIVFRSIGGTRDQYWNTIIDSDGVDKILFISKNVKYDELKQLIESSFSLNNRVQSQYLEFSFETWNAILVEREILIKNKNKKKNFIDPFLDTLEKKCYY